MAKKDKQKKNSAATAGAVPPMAPPVGVVPPVAGMNSTGMYPPPAGMNSTGMYPPMGGINSTGMYPPPAGMNSTGMYPPPMGGVNSTGMYTGTTTTTTTYQTNAAAMQQQPAGKGKKKKGKGKKNPNAVAANVDTSKFNAEQMAQYQLDEAIRESVDPASRLKKLKSPLSVGGCLIMLAIFLVVTTLAVFFICWILVDKFDPILIAGDMLEKSGIAGVFRAVIQWFKDLFGGGKSVVLLLNTLMGM